MSSARALTMRAKRPRARAASEKKSGAAISHGRALRRTPLRPASTTGCMSGAMYAQLRYAMSSGRSKRWRWHGIMVCGSFVRPRIIACARVVPQWRRIVR